MIFKPELVALIRNQRKTETRRKVTDKPCRYEAQHKYAVQPGRGEKGETHIWVTSVRQEQLGELTHQDALREGFENIGGFLDYWDALHNFGWRQRKGEKVWVRVSETDLDALVWVISFELYKQQDRPFVPPKDTVRSLRVAYDPGSPADGVGPERRRAPEPEPVDPARIHPGWSLRAEQRRVRGMLEREADFKSLPIAEQVRRAIEDARGAGIDTTLLEKSIERRVESLRSKTRRNAA